MRSIDQDAAVRRGAMAGIVVGLMSLASACSSASSGDEPSDVGLGAALRGIVSALLIVLVLFFFVVLVATLLLGLVLAMVHGVRYFVRSRRS
jgi:hypothetical protein